jgi:hypothetical protein
MIMKNSAFIKIQLTAMILATILPLSILKSQSFSELDEDPHDIVYYRPTKDSDPQVRVVYGRPKSEDPQVFGTLVPYGEVWKTGSNESTEVRFYCDVMFGNQFVRAGTYSLYTIPEEHFWTVILNARTDTYGSHFYDPALNIAKIEVPAVEGEWIDYFSIGFSEKKYGSQMVLGWAETRVKIPLYTEENLISKI